MPEHATPQRARTRVEIREVAGPLPTPCKVWQGCVDGQGYAKRTSGRRHVNVHREVWELDRGPVPPGYVLHHWCENKLCLEIEHMEVVSRGDHVRIHRKGRPMIGGWQANA